MEEISIFMHAGFTGMKERMKTMDERQKRLEQEMRAQHEFMRDQFQAFNMHFPPPPPPRKLEFNFLFLKTPFNVLFYLVFFGLF